MEVRGQIAMMTHCKLNCTYWWEVWFTVPVSVSELILEIDARRVQLAIRR